MSLLPLPDLIGSMALLRSGGPAMTVMRVRPNAHLGSDLFETEWFDATGHIQHAVFDRRELVILPKGEA